MVNMIEEGRHRCADPVLASFVRTESRTFQFMFLASSLYLPEVGISYERPWNKLCGLSYRLFPGLQKGRIRPGHHIESARLGWRQVGDRIELAAYTYTKGERTIQSLGFIPTGRQYKVEFKVDADGLLAIHVSKIGSGERIATYYEFINAGRRGYLLNPYFGGPDPSPQNIVFFLKDLGQ